MGGTAAGYGYNLVWAWVGGSRSVGFPEKCPPRPARSMSLFWVGRSRIWVSAGPNCPPTRCKAKACFGPCNTMAHGNNYWLSSSGVANHRWRESPPFVLCSASLILASETVGGSFLEQRSAYKPIRVVILPCRYCPVCGEKASRGDCLDQLLQRLRRSHVIWWVRSFGHWP